MLMGGGIVTAAAIPLLRGPDCDAARQQAGECRTGSSSPRSGWTTSTSWGGSGSGSTGSGSTGAGSSADAGGSATSVARGGFGATGSAHGSGS